MYAIKTPEDLKREYEQKVLTEKTTKQKPIKPISAKEKINAIDYENKLFFKYGITKNDTEFFEENKEISYYQNIAENEKGINGFIYVVTKNSKNLKGNLTKNLKENTDFFNTEYADFLNLFNKQKYKKNELKTEINLFIDTFKNMFYDGFKFNNEFLNYITYKTTTTKQHNKKQKIILLILKEMKKRKLIKKSKEKVFYYAGLRGDNLRKVLKSNCELKTNEFNPNNSLIYFINFKNGLKKLLYCSKFSLLDFDEMVLKCYEKILNYFNCNLISENKQNLYIEYTNNETQQKHNLTLNKKSFNLFIDNLISEGYLSRKIIYTKHNNKNAHKHINQTSQKLVKRYYTKDLYTLIKQKEKKRNIKVISMLDILKTMENEPKTEKTIKQTIKQKVNQKKLYCSICDTEIKKGVICDKCNIIIG